MALVMSTAGDRSTSTDVLDNTDCDDADSTENPSVTWYADTGDLFGDPNNTSTWNA